jgi:hypothetical protein
MLNDGHLEYNCKNLFDAPCVKKARRVLHMDEMELKASFFNDIA